MNTAHDLNHLLHSTCTVPVTFCISAKIDSLKSLTHIDHHQIEAFFSESRKREREKKKKKKRCFNLLLSILFFFLFYCAALQNNCQLFYFARRFLSTTLASNNLVFPSFYKPQSENTILLKTQHQHTLPPAAAIELATFLSKIRVRS